MKPSLTIILALYACLPPAEAAENGFNEVLKPAFAQNCVKCHGEKGKVKGKVDLLSLETAEDLEANEKLLGKLIEVLEFEDMPPEEEPLLDPKLRKQMVGELKMVLHSALKSKKAFTHTPIRRMNRFQYNNAVKDLFQLKVSVFPLPERMLREYGDYFQPKKRKMPDKVKVGSRPLGKSQLIEPRLVGVDPFPQDLRAEHGFDNRGDHLSPLATSDGSLPEAQQVGAGKQKFRPEDLWHLEQFLCLAKGRIRPCRSSSGALARLSHAGFSQTGL